MTKKNKRLSPFKLFYNDRFVLFFAIVTAAILWLVMSAINTEDRPRIIYDVPVTITLSDSAQEQGLRVFEQSVETAQVAVKGNSLIVNKIKSGDLKVVAQLASSITQPNTYTLALTAQKNSEFSDYEIVGVEPENIMITVDVYKEVTFPIEDMIQYKANPDYFVSTPSFSAESVVVSGPETEIAKISKITAEYDAGEVSESKSFNVPLTVYDTYGDKMDTSKLNLGVNEVEVTIPVLSRKVVDLEAVFKNKPSGILEASISVDPVSIEIAGPEEQIKDMTSIQLDEIDFTTISPSSPTVTGKLTMPQGFRNLSNVYTAQIKLNLSGYTTKSFEVTNFTVSNLADGKTSRVYTESLDVTVAGPSEQLDALSASDITALIDMEDKDSISGYTEVPLSFTIKNANRCWVYGSYQANIQIIDNS